MGGWAQCGAAARAGSRQGRGSRAPGPGHPSQLTRLERGAKSGAQCSGCGGQRGAGRGSRHHNHCRGAREQRGDGAAVRRRCEGGPCGPQPHSWAAARTCSGAGATGAPRDAAGEACAPERGERQGAGRHWASADFARGNVSDRKRWSAAQSPLEPSVPMHRNPPCTNSAGQSVFGVAGVLSKQPNCLTACCAALDGATAGVSSRSQSSALWHSLLPTQRQAARSP